MTDHNERDDNRLQSLLVFPRYPAHSRIRREYTFPLIDSTGAAFFYGVRHFDLVPRIPLSVRARRLRFSHFLQHGSLGPFRHGEQS